MQLDLGVYNFDMIAYDGNGDGEIELHCGTMNSSIELGNLLQSVVNDYDLNLAPVQLTYGSTDRSDHASFWEFNYPAILGIEDFSGDFNPYYHTTSDNMTPILRSLPKPPSAPQPPWPLPIPP
jgi:Zn-dependent M28 family amino/carboxypeptidase